jgi:hypothetical protein
MGFVPGSSWKRARLRATIAAWSAAVATRHRTVGVFFVVVLFVVVFVVFRAGAAFFAPALGVAVDGVWLAVLPDRCERI